MPEPLTIHELMPLLVGLLLLAAATSVLSQWLRLPLSVLLVVMGISLGQLAGEGSGPLQLLHRLPVSSDLILLIFLPTLVFESAFNLDGRQLRRNLLPVLILAVPGVLLATAVLGGLLWLVTPLDASTSLILGAILSATDPVAVIALFRQLGAPKRLTVLLEGESLFNDATAIVLTRLLLGIALSGSFGGADIALGVVEFLAAFFGGALVGWLLGLAAGGLLGRLDKDPLLEIQLTLILAYASFLIAEELFHVSGVMATVAAGLTLGGWGRPKIPPAVTQQLGQMWAYFAFVANALIFLLVGLQVHPGELINTWDLLVWTIVGMLLSRLLVVFGLTPLLNRLPESPRVSRRYLTVMYWGGLRGAIALALVLSLPDLPYRAQLLAVVTGAVLFTLLVQGSTIGPLIRRLGLDRPPLGDRLAQLEASLAASREASQRIPELQQGGLFSDRIARALQDQYRRYRRGLHEQLDNLREEELNQEQERRILYLRGFAVEKDEYYRLYSKGHLSEPVYRELNLSLALQADSIRHSGRMPAYTLRSRGMRQRIQSLVTWLRNLPGFGTWGEHLHRERLARDYERSWAQFQGASKVLRELGALSRIDVVRPEVFAEVRSEFRRWQQSARRRLDATAEQFPEFVNAMHERLAQRILLLTERREILRQRRAGLLPAGATQASLQALDRKLRRLRGYLVQPLQLEPEQLLRKVPLFKDLPAEELKEVIDSLRSLTLGPGETVIHQGAPGKSLFLIGRGLVRISRHGQDLATLLAGDFFGESALLHRTPRNADCTTVTPSLLYELQREDLDRVCERYPVMRQTLERTVQEREGD